MTAKTATKEVEFEMHIEVFFCSLLTVCTQETLYLYPSICDKNIYRSLQATPFTSSDLFAL